jgi:hypothetical protein
MAIDVVWRTALRILSRLSEPAPAQPELMSNDDLDQWLEHHGRPS